MSNGSAPGCPICGTELSIVPRGSPGLDAKDFDCPNCGVYRIDNYALPLFSKIRAENPATLGLLSHIVYRMQGADRRPTLSHDSIDHLLTNNRLPTPVEQMENVLQWMGGKLSVPGEYVELTPARQGAAFGTVTDDNFHWLIQHMMDDGLLEGSAVMGPSFHVTLTFLGWEAFEEIRRGTVESRTAFMAMSFGDVDLDEVFIKCFKPAVKAAGFDLIRLDENPKAGLIDDRLRVEIRRARFLVADLTHGNHGAYWEAGFAEELGKPVIYTCERGIFDASGTHFDTNHHHTVLWTAADLDESGQELAATVRATMPTEATLDD